jgi:hypothetical protein
VNCNRLWPSNSGALVLYSKAPGCDLRPRGRPFWSRPGRAPKKPTFLKRRDKCLHAVGDPLEGAGVEKGHSIDVRAHAGSVPRPGRCPSTLNSTGGAQSSCCEKRSGMLLKCIVFASLGYSYGPARYSGSEEGMVPATVAQAADCGNRRETKGQRGAGDRQGRECINFLSSSRRRIYPGGT